MKLEKQLLSKRILAMYNYSLTKKEFSAWLEDTELLKFKLKGFYIPSQSNGFGLKEGQFVQSTVSIESKCIEYKIDLERELETREKAFDQAFETLIPIEQSIYKKSYEKNCSCCQMACDENTYLDYINWVKQSAVVKIAIILSIAVLKKESVK